MSPKKKASPRIGLTYASELEELITGMAQKKLIDTIEIVPDEFFFKYTDGYKQLKKLLSRIDLPYAFHFVSNSICSADFIQNNALDLLNNTVEFDPIHISDHLTCSRIGNMDLTGNIPTIYSEASLQTTIENIRFFKKHIPIKKMFLLEHIPNPFFLKESSMPWEDFYLTLLEETDSFCLLDLHNLYCEEENHNFDVISFIEKIPPQRVQEIHLAGGYFEPKWQHYCDGHCDNIPQRVFELFELSLSRFNPTLINLERESNFIDLHLIEKDLERINALCH